jgi:hypothetical protein
MHSSESALLFDGFADAFVGVGVVISDGSVDALSESVLLF